MSNRRGLIVLILSVSFAFSGCVRTIKVPAILPIEAPQTVEQLADRVKALASVERIQASVSLQFRDLRDSGIGKNKQYPAAAGTLVLSRPQRIRLRIKAPFIGKNIADMVSNGTSFRVKIYYPEDKRKFILGSNAGRYKRVDQGMKSNDPQLQQAGALANIRPQHLTDAFLLETFPLGGERRLYTLDELQLLEPNTSKGAKGETVIRTFYVLTLLETTDGPEAKVLRRLWFDRSKTGTPLAKQELYEDGRVATSIRYDAYEAIGEGRSWPTRVTIERTEDLYSVDVIFEAKALTINGEVPEEAFELQNDEGFPEIDLDKRSDVIAPSSGGSAQ